MAKKKPSRMPGMRPSATTAPYDSCVACYKGDTTTGVVIHGEAEFIIAGIHRLTGIPLDQADRTFGVLAEHDMGCDPGKVPVEDVDAFVRLCADCAQKTGARIVEHRLLLTEGARIFTYVQPPHLRTDPGDWTGFEERGGA
jgi:hypothetical protein